MSTYKGIIGHEKQGEINEVIISSRFDGLGWREIEPLLKRGFGLSVSHTTIRAYYMKELSGGSLDKAKEQAIVKALGSLPSSEDSQETEIDQNRLIELEKIYNPEGKDPIGSLYSKMIALCEANTNDHIETGARLKTHYVKYLKDIKAVFNIDKK